MKLNKTVDKFYSFGFNLHEGGLLGMFSFDFLRPPPSSGEAKVKAGKLRAALFATRSEVHANLCSRLPHAPSGCGLTRVAEAAAPLTSFSNTSGSSDPAKTLLQAREVHA